MVFFLSTSDVTDNWISGSATGHYILTIKYLLRKK